MGFRAEGIGHWVEGLGFRVLELRIKGLGFRLSGF